MLPVETVAELTKLWELTTVTKKLRRVARLSPIDLSRAGMLVRPSRVALTFMNYEFPQWWMETPKGELEPQVEEYVAQVAAHCRAPVTMLTFGPESNERHIAEVYVEGRGQVEQYYRVGNYRDPR
jgi:hypothetical protein